MTQLRPDQGARLIASLDRIIESHAFSAERLPRIGDELDAKEAANRHAAARAALSHLEHVLKIAAPGSAAQSTGELLASARTEIRTDEEASQADDASEPG